MLRKCRWLIVLAALVSCHRVCFPLGYDFDHDQGWLCRSGRAGVKGGVLWLKPSRGKPAQVVHYTYVDFSKQPMIVIKCDKGQCMVEIADYHQKDDLEFRLVKEALGPGTWYINCTDATGLTGRKNIVIRIQASVSTALDYLAFVATADEEPVLMKESPPAAEYTCRRSIGKIGIDGVLDESSWQKAPSTGPFPLFHGMDLANFETEAKMLWDHDNFYLAIECEDPDITATKTERDDSLWTEDVIELFVMEQKYKSRYNHFVEFEVTPLGTMMDIYNVAPFQGLLNWDSKGWQCAVKRDGTPEKGDEDRSWTVEMAIPFANFYALPFLRARCEQEWPWQPLRPAHGDRWRLNIYRIEVGADYAEYITWSPLVKVHPGGFHQTNRFGTVIFSERSVGF